MQSALHQHDGNHGGYERNVPGCIQNIMEVEMDEELGWGAVSAQTSRRAPPETMATVIRRRPSRPSWASGHQDLPDWNGSFEPKIIGKYG